jgi:hypothetical protein
VISFKMDFDEDKFKKTNWNTKFMLVASQPWNQLRPRS